MHTNHRAIRRHSRTLLDTPLRDVLRGAACTLIVGTVLWMPVLVALLRAKP